MVPFIATMLFSTACGAQTEPQSKTKPAQPAAGTLKVNPKDGLRYVWIPPGTFMMGCSPGDGQCYDDFGPSHRVTITKGYWIGQTEVTQAAYERMMGSNPSTFKGASLPVEEISWDEARTYCAAVGMRLPTEAEWEYAARGGKPEEASYAPDDIIVDALHPAHGVGTLDAVAWYFSNSGGRTHAVGQKKANGYGLYDMLGNVWEWVADWYGNYGSDPVNDPQGPSSGQDRVRRGGAWVNFDWIVRASLRVKGEPGGRFIGVRCAGSDIRSK
jgi:formylglycine-generating enzyme required for sulfatase activity